MYTCTSTTSTIPLKIEIIRTEPRASSLNVLIEQYINILSHEGKFAPLTFVNSRLTHLITPLTVRTEVMNKRIKDKIICSASSLPAPYSQTSLLVVFIEIEHYFYISMSCDATDIKLFNSSIAFYTIIRLSIHASCNRRFYLPCSELFYNNSSQSRDFIKI